MKHILLLSCEHATNFVPEKYSLLFKDQENVLSSHRGWDPGALELVVTLQPLSTIPALIGEVSRLLIELNRSPNNPQIWSEYTASLSKQEQETIKQTYYESYHTKITELVEKFIATGNHVIHLSVHTFTPMWEGHQRDVDIGLLFDHERLNEWKFVQDWQGRLNAVLADLRVMQNQPYNGTDDGLTTVLRKTLAHHISVWK